jgi:hypothetical protein
MIYVGLDDTDVLDGPGTNQLARQIVRELAGEFDGQIILRHQLLQDPRVPCTKKNGCASMRFQPIGSASYETFIGRVRDIVLAQSAPGSDPGLCVMRAIPLDVLEWGVRCQHELLTQAEARQLAAEHDVHLEGLGGTQDGVIGALAAIGLMATQNDGRVVHFGSSKEDWYDVTGCLDAGEVLSRGVDEIRVVDSQETVNSGTIDIGKRLRPNVRDGKIVLYVTRNEAPHWEAVRVT